jgi:hypothetical protein
VQRAQSIVVPRLATLASALLLVVCVSGCSDGTAAASAGGDAAADFSGSGADAGAGDTQAGGARGSDAHAATSTAGSGGSRATGGAGGSQADAGSSGGGAGGAASGGTGGGASGGAGGTAAGGAGGAGGTAAGGAGGAGAGSCPSRKLPSQILDLTPWYLTLPTGVPGDPDDIYQPQLASFSVDPWFMVNADCDAVVFRANAGGVTTSGSSYARSELREMQPVPGKVKAAWATNVGRHTMIATQAITRLPVAKPDVVVNQIHDPNCDIIMVRLVRSRLYVEGFDLIANTKGVAIDYGTLDASYKLGTYFTTRIVAENDKIAVYFNDMTTPKVIATLPWSVPGNYFKAGSYVHSNVAKGDLPEAYSEVLFTRLEIIHE